MCKARIFLDRTKSAKGPIAIVIHSGGDPDAVASAFSLKLLIEKLNPRVSVALFAPGGLSDDGARLFETLGLSLQERPCLKEAETVILADTADLPHASLTLNDISEHAEILVVDHHKTRYPDYVKLAFSDTCKSSSELVLQLYDTAGETPTQTASWALAIGISCDTARLATSDNRSLLALSRLVQNGVNIGEVLSWMRCEMKEDERIARIKAAQRARVIRSQGFLIGISNVGSYNASAASGLLSLGFDLAVVVSEKKKELTVSIRATSKFFEKTGLSVGEEICQEFCRLYGGSGGGHECVGIIHHISNKDEFLRKFMKFLEVTIQAKVKGSRNAQK